MIGKEYINRVDNSFYVYNNEAFVFGVIQEIIIIKNKINIGRLFILICLLLQDKLINNPRINEYNSLNEFLINNTSNITQFPKIFQELLPIIVNALTLMEESDIIELRGNNIVYNLHIEYLFNSNRLDKIKIVIPKIFQFTESLPDKQLYDLLNVQL